jgi:NADH-quinone oxidoreductase subunit N
MILVAAAVAVLFADLFLEEGRKRILCDIAITGAVAALLAVLGLGPVRIEGFSGMIVHDALGIFSSITVLSVALLALLMSIGYFEWEDTRKGEFYALLLLSVAGMLVLAKGTDLMTVFLGLETMSIPVYCLAGFHRHRMTSVEGALKYFLLGASFASAFLLYGMALIYASTGATKIAVIAAMAADLPLATDPVFFSGVGLLLVGFGFKVSLVPFHMWTPDAYEGAPTIVTAFMGAAVKAAGFAALVRVALLVFPPLLPWMSDILWVLSVLTMTVGNLSALFQDNMKRMLAWSSIAHAGSIRGGLTAGNGAGAQAAVCYLPVYALMNLGAFGVLMLAAPREDDGYDIRDLAGMGLRHPLLGALLSLFLVSLAGIPPTSGFIGKFPLFGAAVKGGHVPLAVLGVLNSVVSVYYYLRPVVHMYMTQAPGDRPAPRPFRTSFYLALFLTAASVLVLGVAPGFFLALAEWSVMSLLM